uniref:Activin types I and II receptor domain-containing protein n=1 Tax=Ascaris lumbricoides TaxID=6252 RepID=A0A9J2PJX5_ASCLU
MKGLYVGVILALCFSLVSTLECVIGNAYGSTESEKRNDECDDAEFCVNYTYKASNGAEFHTRYDCSTGTDSISMEFLGGSPCEQSGCHKVIADGNPYAHPDAEICCCDEDLCNDANSETEVSFKRAGNRWVGRMAIIDSWD